MPYVYAFWNSSGNPPSPWTKISTYDNRYIRCTSNTGQGLVTGGANSHTHTVNSITCTEVTDPAIIKFDTGDYCLRSVTNSKHAHGTSGITFYEANNLPSYYTLALIRCDISQFFNSDVGGRRLYQYMVCASTQAISFSGYNRFSSLDNKFVMCHSTVGSGGGGNSHTHTVSGYLDNFVGTKITSISGSRGLKPTAGGDYHNHQISSSSSSAISTPPYIQTRLYQISLSQVNIPVNVVLFVDGSISGYTDFFQILTGWDARFLMGGDINPTTGGAETHSHSSPFDIVSMASTNAVYGSAGTLTAIQSTHTHTATVSIDTTPVSHIPLYVNLIPVAVIKEISPLTTKTKTYTTNTCIRKTVPKSYTMDVAISIPGGKYISADVLILKKNLLKQYTTNLRILKLWSKIYNTDLLIVRRDIRNAYKMGISVWHPAIFYSMGIMIISSAKPVTSIINTLLDSYAEQYNKIYKKIQAASGDMKIEYASGEALERNWGRVYNMPRKPEESDVEYRSRLVSYEQSVLGSGTVYAIKNILNFITKGSRTRILVTPGKINIYFDDDEQRRNAKLIFNALQDVLKASVAAGIQFTIFFGYVDLLMGIRILKRNILKSYIVNCLIAKPFTIEYNCNIVSIKRMIKTYMTNILLQKKCTVPLAIFMTLQKTCSEEYIMDFLSKKVIISLYNIDVLMKKNNIPLLYSEGVMIQKTVRKTYLTNIMLAGRHTKFYAMHLITKQIIENSYEMSLTIV